MISLKNKHLKLSGTAFKILLSGVIGTMMMAMLTGLTTVSNVVTIHDNGQSYSKYTIYRDADDILKDQNIQLNPEDKLEFTGFSHNEGEIVIKRAFNVTVSADGKTQTIVMTEGTVEEALAKAGVTFGENDLINIALTETVTNETSIMINRVTYTQEQISTLIPFESIQTETPKMKIGTNRVASAGENGEMITTKQTKYIDGAPVETNVIAEEVVKQPVTREVLVGTSNCDSQLVGNVELDGNGNPLHYSQKVVGRATAYSALGRPTKLVPGNVAMDLSRFPRGTKLYIKTPNGGYVYGYSSVADTGTAVKSGKVLVDLFFNTYEESARFGVKEVEVYVLN